MRAVAIALVRSEAGDDSVYLLVGPDVSSTYTCPLRASERNSVQCILVHGGNRAVMSIIRIRNPRVVAHWCSATQYRFVRKSLLRGRPQLCMSKSCLKSGRCLTCLTLLMMVMQALISSFE